MSNGSVFDPVECALPGANNWAPRCGGGFFGAGTIVSPRIAPGQSLGPGIAGTEVDPGQLVLDVGDPFAPPVPTFIGFVAPPVMPSTRPPSAPSFSPTGPNYGPQTPSFEPIYQPGAGSGPARPPDFYTPENPPPNLPPIADLVPPAELPFIGMLGLLGGIGVAGIGASLAVGAPAPDEYGTQDIQALIDAGFYGNLTPSPLVPRYQPPDVPSQTELAPAVAAPAPAPEPTLPDVVITAPRPGIAPEIPAYVVPPFFPLPGDISAPAYRTVPVGLPHPGPRPGVFPRPGTGPAILPTRAPAPAPGAAPQPGPVLAPAPSAPAAASTRPATPPAPVQQLTGPTTITGPAPGVSPLTDTQPAAQPAPTKPALALLTMPEALGSVPPLSTPKSHGCEAAGPQKKQQQKKRKDRTVCHSGTYIERKQGLSKHPARQVPCR